MGLPYAQEKFDEAVKILATHPGDITERLCAAAKVIIPISPSEDIPAALRSRFQEIRQVMSTRSDGITAKLSNGEALIVAERIRSFESDLRGCSE